MIEANTNLNPPIDDLRITSIRDVAFPAQVMAEIPASAKAIDVVQSVYQYQLIIGGFEITSRK